MKKEVPADDSLDDEDKDKPNDAEAEELLALYRQSAEAARKEQDALNSCLTIKLDLRARAEAKQARGARGTAVSPSQQPPAHKRTKLQEGKTVFC